MKLLPEKLRALIKSRGFTIKSFGSKLDMTSGGVYDILKRKYLKPDLIEKICKVLTVQPEEFIEYEFPKNIKEKLYAQENSNTSDLEKENKKLQKRIDELREKVILLYERLDSKNPQFDKQFDQRIAKALAAALSGKKN